ncbi:MAG: DUF2007 domain-containing protein [Flavicella sp.]
MPRKKIYSSNSQIDIMSIKNLLSSEGIHCFELNKSDSSYVGIFDEIQLFINEEDTEKAIDLINKNHNSQL